MKKYLLCCLIILILAIPTSSIFATVYTVNDGGGEDYTTISACIGDAIAGDTCLVSAGTYSGFTFSASGDSNTNRIIVLADNEGAQPVINSTVAFGSQDYVTIDGFKLTSGFSGNGCSFIQIQNNFIQRSGSGVSITCDDVLISGNTFDLIASSTYDIIRQWGDRWVIRNNNAIDLDETVQGNHLDFWQTWCDSPTDLSGDFALVENNFYGRDGQTSTSVVSFFMLHPTSQCDGVRHNYIIRYNKIKYIGNGFITVDVDDSPGVTGIASYNNTVVEIYYGSSASWMDYPSQLVTSSFSMSANNLYYDSGDFTGFRAVLPESAGCSGSLAYDPGNTITTTDCFQTCVSAGNCIVNTDPLFANYGNLATSPYDFSVTLPEIIDGGYHLTEVAVGDSGTGTSLVVDNSYIFQPGWAGTSGDWIAVGTVENIVQISSINYGTNTLTIAPSIERSEDDSVWLYRDSDGTRVLYGSAPDIGAFERIRANASTGGTSLNGASLQ